jgi:hypothetical protein
MSGFVLADACHAGRSVAWPAPFARDAKYNAGTQAAPQFRVFRGGEWSMLDGRLSW